MSFVSCKNDSCFSGRSMYMIDPGFLQPIHIPVINGVVPVIEFYKVILLQEAETVNKSVL